MSEDLITCLNDINGDLGDCNYYDLEDIVVKEHSMCALHLNVHGLASKVDSLKDIIATLHDNNVKVDFILLCETFFNEYNKCFCNIDGYQLICKHRPKRK